MGWRRTSSANLESIPSRSRGRTVSDVEKYRYSDDENDDYSSPVHSTRPLVSHHVPTSKRQYLQYMPKQKQPRLIRIRHGITRYICFGIAVLLLLFMLSLVRMSHVSEKKVQEAIVQDKATPKPPLYESFPFLQRYYGGIRNLVSKKDNVPEYPQDEDRRPTTLAEKAQTPESGTPAPVKRATVPDSKPFDPYPRYTSEEYTTRYGEKVDCYLDERKTIQVPRVRMYEGIPKGLPDNIMGSAELLGIRDDICYDRFGRLGPYGLGYSLNRGGSGAQQAGEREGADLVWRDHAEVDFRNVKWVEVQQRCNSANAHRFNDMPKPRIDRFRPMQVGSNVLKRATDKANPKTTTTSTASKLPRTAVIIRTWWDYQYTSEDLVYLRSIIAELNVLSGGEYTVHFLIHVKDDNAQIWSDDETYERVLRDSLPEEFRGMGTLWTERQMFLIYGGLPESWMRDLPVHGVYRSTFMPMQYFAYQHPEYDYFWHWEMDTRSTHHWYHLFDSVTKWAKKQPRKYLWERNARFYIPAEHGSWEDFSHTVRVQTDQGTSSANNLWSGLRAGGRTPGAANPVGAKQESDRPIWGPEYPLDDDVRMAEDMIPPTTFDKDKYSWGVDEDADLITFNPLFDPDGTSWLLAEDTTGYNTTRGQPPRRTAIITASRLSRKLLTIMHKELVHKRHSMFSEMWPASCALHHGLKAVYAPHPEYIDRRWPLDYLEKTFNGGRNGASGGARTSVFGDREHNFRGTTWYYNAGFPEVLWHRWLGMKMHNDGGELFETEGEGRMCLPGMLLHPVKRVDMVIEGKRAD